MYSLYSKEPGGSGTRFNLATEPICLFGCVQGMIPKMMLKRASGSITEPAKWQVPIEDALLKDGRPGHTIVINLKPKLAKETLCLYELEHVWGLSSHGWTKILLLLRGLLVDVDPTERDRKDFTLNEHQLQEHFPIYEVLYLAGTVSRGKLQGRWTAPPASPTNAVLMWPETLRYFTQCIQTHTPEVLRGII